MTRLSSARTTRDLLRAASLGVLGLCACADAVLPTAHSDAAMPVFPDAGPPGPGIDAAAPAVTDSGAPQADDASAPPGADAGGASSSDAGQRDGAVSGTGDATTPGPWNPDGGPST